jgi:pyridoxamine 5'-phosphate oxidase
MDISDLRREYDHQGLRRQDLLDDPFGQFERWFQQACQVELLDPNAMILATVDAQGQPSQRTVLLKYFDQRGFVFFTNYTSRKAHEITVNRQVSLLFLWLPLERQVAISGTADRIPTAESLAYFATRPRGSQLGAWCSQQSSIISSRQLLEVQLERMRQKFLNREVPLPDFWGGYRVVAQRFEFWQGRPNRLHDRFAYLHQSDGTWQISRLSP